MKTKISFYKGDLPGHPFRGNQYTGGASGDRHVADVKLPTSDADIPRFLNHVEATQQYQDTVKRLDDLAAQTKSGDVTQWSRENNTDENGNYTAERTALHDEMIQNTFTEDTRAPDGVRPVAVMMLGSPGVGKTTSSADAMKEITSMKLATINADDVKGALPEYEGWNAAALHEESSDVAEGKMIPYGVENGHNMLLDMTGANSGKMAKIAEALHMKGYDVHLISVTAPNHVSVGRAWKRYAQAEKRGEKGRFVPPRYALKSDHKPDQTYTALKGKAFVASWMQIDSSASTPKILDQGKQ